MQFDLKLFTWSRAARARRIATTIVRSNRCFRSVRAVRRTPMLRQSRILHVMCIPSTPTVRSRCRRRVVTAAVAGEKWAGKHQTIAIDGVELSFDYFPGKKPIVMYLPQFYYAKDPFAKSNTLRSFCERRGQSFIVQDYFGTGRSGGRFEDGTISMWTDHIIEIFERVLRNEKVLLVTSGVGVWVGMKVALRRSKQVMGIVGMSVDPDFTEELLVPSFTDEQKKQLDTEGTIDVCWGNRTYPISKTFLDDARNNLILSGGPNSININCPIRLLQGMADEEVPTELAMKLATNLKSTDVTLTYIKEATHIMEREVDFELMCDKAAELLDQYYEFDIGSPGAG